MARTPKVVEDRREQILEVALQVFAEKGFDRATNKDIAQAAGVTSGLIYHYFESKEELLKAIFKEHSPRHLLDTLPHDVAHLPPDVFLRQVAYQILTIVESEPYIQLSKIFLSQVHHHSKMATIGFSAMREVLTLLEGYVESQMEQGVLRRTDPSLVIQLFGGSIMAMMIRRHLLHDPLALQYTQEQIVEGAVTLTLQGLMTT